MLKKLINTAIRMANRMLYIIRVILFKYPLFALASAAVAILCVGAVAVMLIRPNFGGDSAIGGNSPTSDGKYPDTGIAGGDISGYVSEDDIQSAVHDLMYGRDYYEFYGEYSLNADRCWISIDRCQYVFLIESYSKVLGVNVYTMCSFNEVGKENGAIVLNSYHSLSPEEYEEIESIRQYAMECSGHSWKMLQEVLNNEK